MASDSKKIWEKGAIDAKGDAYISGKLFVNNTEVKPSFDKTEILNMVYPVGAIYMSTSSANPSTFIGGTWQRYAQGRTIVGVSENETEFNYVGKTGGAKTHTLTNEEMPSHSHGDKTISSVVDLSHQMLDGTIQMLVYINQQITIK